MSNFKTFNLESGNTIVVNVNHVVSVSEWQGHTMLTMSSRDGDSNDTYSLDHKLNDVYKMLGGI